MQNSEFRIAPLLILHSEFCILHSAFRVLLVLIALPAFGQHYEGTISTPGTPLAVEIDVDGAKATITIPAQNIKAWALTKVVFDATTFSADMPNVPGNPHFEGKRDGDKISGIFSQGGGLVPFSLEKKETHAAAATDAMAGFDDFAA